MGGAVNIDRLPVNIMGAAQRKMQHAGSHCGIGYFINQHKTAELMTVGIGRKYHRSVGRQFDHTDFIQAQCLGRQMLHIIDIDGIFRRLHPGRDGLRAEAQLIGATGQHFRFIHPNQTGFKAVCRQRRIIGCGNDIAARTVNFIIERQRHRLTGQCFGQIGATAIGRHSDNLFHRAGLARGHNAYLIAGLDRAARHAPAKSAKIEIGPIDPLHRHGKALLLRRIFSQFDIFKMRQKRRPFIPSRVVAEAGNIVTGQPRYGNGQRRRHIEIGGKGSEIIDNVMEAGFAEIDQIHFIDRQNNMFNAQ